MIQSPTRMFFWKSKKIDYLLLILFLLLNLITKFFYLSDESIYGDEAYSIYHAQKPLSELTDLFLHDQNPPLQIVTLHFWMSVFGVSDFSAKSLSVILTVLCSVVLFLFAKKFLNRSSTILVSILFLLSNVQLFYSHEARVYPLVQFLCICSFYLYFELINKPNKWKVLLFVFINLSLLFSHYLSVFILVTQFVCIWMYFKENKKAIIHYLASCFLLGILFLPWIKVVISNLPQGGTFWLAAPHFGELKFFMFWLNGNEFLFYLFTTIIFCSLVMVLLNKKMQFFVKEFDKRVYFIFLVWYILPITLEYTIAQLTPVFLLRYFLYSSIGLCLLISYVIANLNSSKVVRFLIFLPLLYFLIMEFDAKPQKEDDWRALVSRVKTLQNKKMVVFVSASYKLKDFSFYYDLEAFKDYNNTTKRLAEQNVFCAPYLMDSINTDNVDQILFVQAHRQFEDPEEKIKQSILDKNFFICKDYPIINSKLTVFMRVGVDCDQIKIIAEEKLRLDNFWNVKTGYHEQLMDSVLVILSDMEPFPGSRQTNGIVDEIAKSGNFSNRINKENEYSVGIAKTISELKGLREINISAQVYFKENCKGRLVVSLEKDGQIDYWQELSVSEMSYKANIWNEVRLSEVIPSSFSKDYLLKIYFWNQESAPLFIDDFKIVLSGSH